MSVCETDAICTIILSGFELVALVTELNVKSGSHSFDTNKRYFFKGREVITCDKRNEYFQSDLCRADFWFKKRKEKSRLMLNLND